MRIEVQTRLHTNWRGVKASRAFAVANLTAYTTPFEDMPGVGFPWAIYESATTDMLKVLGDDGTIRGFALFDNTGRWWGHTGHPMLVMDVYADSDETLAVMMKHLTELARARGRTRSNFVDVGNPNERGKAALKKLGFTRVAFGYISGAGQATPSVRKLSSLEFETAKGNVPGLVAMTSLSKAGLAPGGEPLPEDLEKKITGFLAPEGREERPEIALSKTALVLRKTGVPTRPEAAPPAPPAPPGGYGPAPAGGPGLPPPAPAGGYGPGAAGGPGLPPPGPAGGRRRKTYIRRKSRRHGSASLRRHKTRRVLSR